MLAPESELAGQTGAGFSFASSLADPLAGVLSEGPLVEAGVMEVLEGEAE